MFTLVSCVPLEGPTATTDLIQIEARDYAVLTEFFKVIKNLNVAPGILKILAGNKLTEPIMVKAIVEFLKVLNLDDLLVAVDKSGLTVDIILKALQDPQFFPGAYEIIDGLKNGESTTPPKSAPDTGSLVSDVGQVVDSYEQFASDGLGDILGDITDTLGIGSSGGIFSFLNPIFNLFGVSGAKGGGETISLSPSATAAASGVVLKPSATATGSATSSAKTSATATKAPTETSTASSTPSGSSSGSGSSSSGGWLSGIFNTIGGWFKETKAPSKRSVLSKRDNEVLNNLVDSLQESGLAMQVVVAIVEDQDNYPFARDLITEIVKEKAISLDELQSALDNSNLLNNGVIDTLKSPDLGISIS